MKRIVLILIVFSFAAQAKCDTHARNLVHAYPHFLKTCRNNRIVWRDGTQMVYDDGKPKGRTRDGVIVHPDIEDMFHDSYIRERYPNPAHDPGRNRYEPLFRKMYGDSAAQVRRHLTTISWFGQKVRVTKVNDVHRHLAAVEHDLRQLVKSKPALKKFLTPIGGTFKWRKIAGTNRLSVHSFGAAIDINVKYSAYWRWVKGKYKYHNDIPTSIVKIFESHGFIWGGKWYHYDTMHFEYRPELFGGRRPTVSHKPSKTQPINKAIPTPAASREYTVVSGDTLYGIAIKLHTKVDALRLANGLSGDTIRVGQKLRIPGL